MTSTRRTALALPLAAAAPVALAASGVFFAVKKTPPPLPPAAPQVADAELIADCAEHARLYRIVNDRHAADDAARAAAFERYTDLHDRIHEARPESWAGWMAKARAAMVEGPGCTAEEWSYQLVSVALSWADGAAA